MADKDQETNANLENTSKPSVDPKSSTPDAKPSSGPSAAPSPAPEPNSEANEKAQKDKEQQNKQQQQMAADQLKEEANKKAEVTPKEKPGAGKQASESTKQPSSNPPEPKPGEHKPEESQQGGNWADKMIQLEGDTKKAFYEPLKDNVEAAGKKLLEKAKKAFSKKAEQPGANVQQAKVDKPQADDTKQAAKAAKDNKPDPVSQQQNKERQNKEQQSKQQQQVAAKQLQEEANKKAEVKPDAKPGAGKQASESTKQPSSNPPEPKPGEHKPEESQQGGNWADKMIQLEGDTKKAFYEPLKDNVEAAGKKLLDKVKDALKVKNPGTAASVQELQPDQLQANDTKQVPNDAAKGNQPDQASQQQAEASAADNKDTAAVKASDEQMHVEQNEANEKKDDAIDYADEMEALEEEQDKEQEEESEQKGLSPTQLAEMNLGVGQDKEDTAGLVSTMDDTMESDRFSDPGDMDSLEDTEDSDPMESMSSSDSMTQFDNFASSNNKGMQPPSQSNTEDLSSIMKQMPKM